MYSAKVAIFLFYFVLCANGYLYNELLDRYTEFKDVPRYPNTCCQLEWAYIGVNDTLPKDYILAGKHSDRNWAYVGMKTFLDKGRVALKSDRSGEEANTLGEGTMPDKFLVDYLEKCPGEDYRCTATETTNTRYGCIECTYFSGARLSNVIRPYPILTNPRQCSVDWFTTQTIGEWLPTKDEWVFPRMSNTKWGDFAQVNGVPARRNGNGGGSTLVRSVTENEGSSAQQITLPYVDCRKSVPSMSRARLQNIKFDKEAMKGLKSEQVVHLKKVMYNYSPVEIETQVTFDINISDNVSLSLNGAALAPYVRADADTYGGNPAAGAITDLLNSVGKADEFNREWALESNAKNIFIASVRRPSFKYSQKVKIPPKSKATLIASSNPRKGNIPFTAVFDIIPQSGHDVLVLKETFKKYGLSKDMTETSRDTLEAQFEGTIVVNTGNSVATDVRTEQISGLIF